MHKDQHEDVLDAAPANAAGLEELPDLSIEALAARITLLEDAFRRCAQEVTGLTVDVVGHVTGSDELVHPVAGFSVRLEGSESEAGGVSLYVSSGYGELTRWRGAGLSEVGVSRERFRVRLVEEYAWGETVFPDPDELAHALVGYMQFNLDSAA